MFESLNHIFFYNNRCFSKYGSYQSLVNGFIIVVPDVLLLLFLRVSMSEQLSDVCN